MSNLKIQSGKDPCHSRLMPREVSLSPIHFLSVCTKHYFNRTVNSLKSCRYDRDLRHQLTMAE